MSRIDAIQWENGDGLEELLIHGIQPTKALLEHLVDGLEERSFDDNPGLQAALAQTVIERMGAIERGIERMGVEVLKPAS